MNIFKRLREKRKANRILSNYKENAKNILVGTFTRGYYLSKKSGWELKAFNNSVRVFNLTGNTESYKFPTHFALKGHTGVVYIFSGLKTGSNKNNKVSGDFDKFDDAFVNRMKNYMSTTIDGGKEALETKPEENSICIHLDAFDRLYLTAVCTISQPHKMIYFDEQINLYELKNKIKEHLIKECSMVRDNE
jgi:hypothetical protein